MTEAETCCTFGIDVGSTTLKVVAVDATGTIVASHVEPTTPFIEDQSEKVLAALRAKCPLGGEGPVGATGYGRKRIPGADKVVTEITCHARGAYHLTRRPGFLIDFGGQDTKVILIGDSGEVIDFAMNDKCAAGTGRFLEVILGRLQVPLEDAAEIVDRASKPVMMSSTCTVFAESEVISLVAQGEPVADIVLGLHKALASRVAALAGRMKDGHEAFMSGGVALNRAMADALSAAIDRPITVLPRPQLVGALGAALNVQFATRIAE
jgi:predicted CoA-substrate-specific enzyme activase